LKTKKMTRYKKPAFSIVDGLQEHGVRPSTNAEFCQFPEPVEALKRRHVYLGYPRPYSPWLTRYEPHRNVAFGQFDLPSTLSGDRSSQNIRAVPMDGTAAG